MIEHKNIILGAGLSGMSAGYHLNEDYAIFEKNSEIGGLARSEESDGFIFDYAPHILYTVNEYASNLIHQLLKGNIHIKKRQAFIYHGQYDLYTQFPFQAHLFGLPSSVILDCLKGVAKKFTNNDQPKPENYEDWIYQKFGKGIAEHLMIPYSKRIWTVDPKTMNYEWIDRRVPDPDFEVILEGALTDMTKQTGFNNDFWYPINGGIEALPKALSGEVQNIHLEMEASRITPDKKIVEFKNGDTVKYERLISSLPLPSIIDMIEGVPQQVINAAKDLDHNSIVCVNLGVDRPNITPYHWLYFYEKDYIFHRISFPMNTSEKTAPPGTSSVCCEIAHSKHRALPVRGREALIEQTRKDLVKCGILKEDDKILTKQLLGIRYAYVIYDLNHRKNIDVIHAYLKSIDIYPCGRFGEWEYFNMDHSIMSGKRTAEELTGGLSQS